MEVHTRRRFKYHWPEMLEQHLKLKNPPIVEAVIDIDCDLPRGWEFEN